MTNDYPSFLYSVRVVRSVQIVDMDNDGIPNESDEDDDGDGIGDNSDNCSDVANPDQIDSDGDDPGSNHSQALDINNNGDIMGWYTKD